MWQTILGMLGGGGQQGQGGSGMAPAGGGSGMAPAGGAGNEQSSGNILGSILNKASGAQYQQSAEAARMAAAGAMPQSDLGGNLGGSMALGNIDNIPRAAAMLQSLMSGEQIRERLLGDLYGSNVLNRLKG